jgi:glycosyltransferase involved in cell wall biosynthesis
MLKAVTRKASEIIVDSYSTQKDLLSALDIAKDKISVIYPAIGDAFHPVGDQKHIESVRERYGLPVKYILYVGPWKPHKNIGRLIKAFYQVRRDSKLPHKLVIGGETDPRFSEGPRLASQLGLREEIIFPGYIRDEDLPCVYCGADIFVFPSLYEGFGLPPLEAMACGTPVVTSNVSALPEVTGNAAVLVNPYKVVEIAEAIYKVLSNDSLRDTLRRKGLERAKEFSYEEFARKTLKVYEKALMEGKR